MTEYLPEKVSFSSTDKRYFLLALGGISFMFLMILIARSGRADPEWLADMLAVIGAFAAIFGALQAWFQRAWLRLDRDGFESSEMDGVGHVGWDEVSEIRLQVEKRRGLPPAQQAAFDFARNETRLFDKTSRFARKGTIRLKENYRMTGDELVALMNAFRTRAMAANEA
ncbi:MAG: hypothetical protein RLN72_06850 [Henriciella sp.]